MLMKVKEIVVVEGKNDTLKIKLACNVDTIETNGSAVSKETIELIKHAQKKRGVIIFTDPDYPGQRIRNIINEAVPGCKHAFLSKEKAQAKSTKKSLGIEHASIEDIRASLEEIYEVSQETVSDITKTDLLEWGLIGGKDSRDRRKRLGDELYIGYTNGKQLLNRLHMFHIEIDELNSAMEHILRRE